MSRKKKLNWKVYLTGIAITFFIIGLIITRSILGQFSNLIFYTPRILGFLGTEKFLVVLQNNNELRPTGGFITALGYIQFTAGIPSIEIKDSYAIPNPSQVIPAEKAFTTLIGEDPFFSGKTFRDANFSPDLKTSREELESLYTQAYPEREIDAVIFINFTALEKILSIYGPITIDGTTFTSQNFFELSQKISKNIDTHNEEELANRKSIMGPLVKEIQKKIIFSPQKYSQLRQIIEELISKNQLLASSNQNVYEGLFKSYKMNHDLPKVEAEKDFIHFNIANIGGRKADRYVFKNIQYTINQADPNNPYVEFEAHFEHFGNYNIQSDVYQAYLRLFTPMGSSLISSSRSHIGPSEVFEENGYQVFDHFIKLNPGQSKTHFWRYKLPETFLNQQEYSLRIWPQPGIQSQQWEVFFRSPNDTLLKGSNLWEIRESLAFWKGFPTNNTNLHIEIENDLFPPIIMWQKFTDLQTVFIRVNEQLDKESAENIAHYRIVDKNKVNSISDTPEVVAAQFSGRDLYLTVSGISPQEEEHYLLEIRDLSDTSGNLIKPNPLQRTLVQRLDSSL